MLSYQVWSINLVFPPRSFFSQSNSPRDDKTRASSRLRYRKTWLIRRLLLDHAWLFHVWNHLRDARPHYVDIATSPVAPAFETIPLIEHRFENAENLLHSSKTKSSISLSLFNLIKMKEKDEEKKVSRLEIDLSSSWSSILISIKIIFSMIKLKLICINIRPIVLLRSIKFVNTFVTKNVLLTLIICKL